MKLSLKDAICITNPVHFLGLESYCELPSKEAVLRYLKEHEGTYDISAEVIAYIKEELYVIPYTRDVYNEISTRFKRGNIPVLTYKLHCSIDSYSAEKWNALCIRQEKEKREAYFDDCVKWCKEHRIPFIPDQALEKCLLIPEDGILVFDLVEEEKIEMPFNIPNFLDSYSASYLGKYRIRNGVLAFVNADGMTYITKNPLVIEMVENVYEPLESLPSPPLSHGEEIMDTALKEKWEKI